MSSLRQELTVSWGESDPSGLVYYAHEVAWFNEVEHEFFRRIGYPIDRMIREGRASFVMGAIQFRFVGPAAYGDRVRCEIELDKIREKTLHWNCSALNLTRGDTICRGTATRVYAEILADGGLRSRRVPDEIREALMQFRPDHRIESR